MVRTPEAHVKAALLVWGRESARLGEEHAASLAGVTVERIKEWESGAKLPSVAQLRKLAEVYKRPLGVFFLPQPPTDFMPVKDFRRLPGGAVEPSRELAAEIRKSFLRREAAIELLAASGTAPPNGWKRLESLDSDPEKAGVQLRQLLGVTDTRQRAWKDPNQALSGWVAAVEQLGVLVFQASRIDVREMRGMSISTPPLAAILLNGGDSPRPRIFSLLHECAHIARRANGLCEIFGDQPAAEEVYCNAVAAAALMPRETFLAEPVVAKAPARFADWKEEDLWSLSKAFGASEEAVVRRLLTLGKTTAAYYQATRDRLQAQEDEKAKEEASGGPPHYRLQFRNLGRPYVGLAFQAFDADAITVSELSSYLGVKTPSLAAMREELARAVP